MSIAEVWGNPNEDGREIGPEEIPPRPEPNISRGEYQMLNSVQQAERSEFQAFFPTSGVALSERRQELYESNRHRVYAVAFWMTGNELAAEDLMIAAFRSAFEQTPYANSDDVDRALVSELKKDFHLGVFTLKCAASADVRNVRSNTLRVDLERAVVELPPTEKLIFLLHDVEQYGHDRIATLIGITERDSHLGLHQARLRIRELLAR